ncbi:hypothetical protein ACHAXR_005528, partial [Thalassiosira sp. AJA248-18]
MSKCAACGKSGDCLKACAACKLVKYCNVACQKAHRPNHKKECKKRAAEISDEALFKQPPPNEDCPICFLRLPLDPSDTMYKSCCGKIICLGCIYANVIARQSAKLICPFCRDPGRKSLELLDEEIERLEKRIEARDAEAMYKLGCNYRAGQGVPQNPNKALELYHQAAKLGCAKSHSNIGTAYYNGEGVEKDFKKARYHWERAAIGGDVLARHKLGIWEGCNTNRAR